MIRNLQVLGLALAAVFAMSAVVSSVASASPALFTAAVPAGVKAGAHGGQIGAHLFTVGTSALTCTTVTYTGEAVTAGPSSTYGKGARNYETCHVVVPLIGTRTMTIITNGCTNTVNVTKNTNSSASGPTPGILTPFSADFTFECSPFKTIEIYIYNTANHNDAGAAVLCRYDVAPQTVNNQIQLTNIAGSPSHIVAHIHARIALTNTTPGGICTNATTATYHGQETGTATNGFLSVNSSVS